MRGGSLPLDTYNPLLAPHPASTLPVFLHTTVGAYTHSTPDCGTDPSHSSPLPTFLSYPPFAFSPSSLSPLSACPSSPGTSLQTLRPPCPPRRARKLRRAVDAVAPLLAAAEADVEYLEQVESEVAQLARYADPEDLIALREVQDELVEAGVMKPPPEAALAAKAAAKGRKATKKAQKGSGGGGGGAQSQGFRRFASPGGYVILVGRNNKQNDVLSHQVANPQDLWMHVRGLPGSHVLLRVEPGRGAPGDEDVECAAALAAWFSKGRASGKADVIVTRAGAWVTSLG